MRLLGTLIGAIAIFLATSALGVAAEPAIPATPTHWATDTAGFLSASTVQALDVKLRDYQQRTGHQVLVYVAPTTGDAPLEDWTVRAFKQWKLGRKGLDDGLALFVFARDRAVRIEVGYGLEAVMPDATASRIIRETIIPPMRAGEPDTAVVAGVDRIVQGLEGGAPSQGAGQDAATVPLSPLQLVFIGLAILAIAIVAVRSPWLALMLLVNIFGGRGGGGISGESGFSGGGGRSGGGGASGRW